MEGLDLSRQSSLASLPSELVGEISTWLRRKDVKRFRLTCKAINKATLHDFRQKFFTKRYYMLTERSLSNLLDISRHPYLSRGVENIDLMTFHVREPLKSPTPGDQVLLQWHGAFLEQQQFLDKNQDRDMLTDAFRNLPSLQKLRIAPYFSGDLKLDDFKRCFGITHLPLKQLEETSEAHSNRLFRTTIIALANAHTNPSCILATPSPSPGLHDSSFRMPTNMETKLPHLFSNLTDLRLQLYLGGEREQKHHFSAMEPTAGVVETNHSQYLQLFLSSAPNLVRLSISQHMLRQCCVDDQLMAWLAQRPGIPSSGPTWGSFPEVTPMHFKFLKVLVLEYFNVSLATLKALVLKLRPSLRRLRLGALRLVCLEEVPHSMDTLGGWSSFFRFLAGNSELESVQLTNLTSHYPRAGTSRYKACCHEMQSFPGAKGLRGFRNLRYCVNVSYSGSDMNGFLEQLASVMTERPNTQTHQHDFGHDNLRDHPVDMSERGSDIYEDDSSEDDDVEDDDDGRDNDESDDDEGDDDESDDDESDDVED